VPIAGAARTGRYALGMTEITYSIHVASMEEAKLQIEEVGFRL
jgi:hypothetical protein